MLEDVTGHFDKQRGAFVTWRRIEFAHTDMAGIIHFSRYPVMMEEAEHEVWRALGSSVHATVEGKKLGWPRVACECQFERPVRFGDIVEIEVRLSHLGTKSLAWDFVFFHETQRIATGRLKTVCCELTDKGPRGVAIPEQFRTSLKSILET